MARKSSPSNASDVVTLADLAPRTRIVGGSERRVFGSDPVVPEEHGTPSSKKSRAVPTGKSVKGSLRNK